MEDELVNTIISASGQLATALAMMWVFLKYAKKTLEDVAAYFKNSRDDAVGDLERHRTTSQEEVSRLQSHIDRLDTRVLRQETIIQDQAKLIVEYQKSLAAAEIRITQLESHVSSLEARNGTKKDDSPTESRLDWPG